MPPEADLGAIIDTALANSASAQAAGSGGISNVVVKENGSGYIQWGNGAVATFKDSSEMSQAIAGIATRLGLDEAALGAQLKAAGLDYLIGRNPDGSLYVDASPQGEGELKEPPQGTQVTTSSDPARAGGVGGSAGTGGVGGVGGVGSGGSVGGSVGGGRAAPPLQPAPSTSLPPIGGAAPGGTGAQNPTVGTVTDPGRQGAPGQGFFDTSGLGAPELGSLFDYLPANFNQLGPEERMAALLGAVTRRQEAGLENQIGRFDASQQERLQRGAGTRALEDQILGDTDVLSEANIQRIVGRSNQGAAQRANVLADALGERRAAMGSARSGSAQTERSAILQSAANQMANTEADIRAQAQQANFQSRLAALQGVGQSQRADVGLGADINARAAGAIGDAQVFGDAFLTQAMLGGGQQANVPQFRTINAGGQVIRERLI